MADASLKFEIKLNYPLFLGITLFAHFLLVILLTPELMSPPVKQVHRTPIKIHTLGQKNSKVADNVFIRPEAPSLPSRERKASAKKIDLKDLNSTAAKAGSRPTQSVRPGQLPKARTAMKGLRYGAEEFKALQGGADLLSSKKMALNFEVPEGKALDELNDAELRLYGFLKRGAMKYVASLSSELQDFQLKNPHLNFPLTEDKQIMTARLTYDGQGNLKQIKSVRWTNIDKLQGFFENVTKRLDTLQNPPKELWVEDGEFTVFVTLQING